MDNSITTSEDRREVDDAAVQQAVEEVAAVAHQQDVIRIAHAMTHDISHGEPVIYFKFFSGSISLTFLFYRPTRFAEKYMEGRTGKAYISH